MHADSKDGTQGGGGWINVGLFLPIQLPAQRAERPNYERCLNSAAVTATPRRSINYGVFNIDSGTSNFPAEVKASGQIISNFKDGGGTVSDESHFFTLDVKKNVENFSRII